MVKHEIVKVWCLERVVRTARPARTADGIHLSVEE